jgi:hypothetical protein
VILNQLKTQFHAAEPVTREFIALVNATFRYYADTRGLFLGKLPAHLHQSDLVSLVNVEIKNRLFQPDFCDGLQDALKALRRAQIRLEDLRREHPDLPPAVNDLARLARLGEKLESLYQRHWEFYRYQTHLNEEEVVRLLLEVDEIAYDWDGYLAGFANADQLSQGLSSRPVPEGQALLAISYRQEGVQHFSVATLRALMDFLDAGYRFVGALFGLNPDAQPLTLLHVEVADPVELHVALPAALEPPYRKLLQYLFLKDMLKRDALLKYVFDVVEKDFPDAKPLAPADAAAFQKDLAAKLKPLPSSARFTFSDRTFPDDEIRVLNELTATLERNHMPYEPLLSPGAKSKPPRAKGGEKVSVERADDARAAAAAAALPAPDVERLKIPPPEESLGARALRAARAKADFPESTDHPHDREYLNLLTERAAK